MKFISVLLLLLYPWSTFAGGSINAVVSSDVSGKSSQGLVVRFIPGEVVEIARRLKGNHLLVRSTQAQYGTDYVSIPANAVIHDSGFSRLKQYNGQKKFAIWSHSYDAGCIVQFNKNGTFLSEYKCNCEDERTARGSIYSHGNIIWAKGACGESAPFHQWAVFVRQKDGGICQVADDTSNSGSLCIQTEGN